MMTRVKIVGGGLSGVLAALEAHRLGVRDIELHESSGRLGGQALPKLDHGRELREVDLRFGGGRDRARELLEWHGMAFDIVEARCGSVSPAAGGGSLFVEDFDGPALSCRGLALAEPAGETLADRIRAYPAEMQAPLSRYAEWRLGDWIDSAHASAAPAMGMARVYPIGADVSTLEELRRIDGLYDDLYAVPAVKAGRAPALAALPHDGFAALFDACGRKLASLGVAVHPASLVSPQEAIDASGGDEVVVWAADPTPLVRAVGLEAPKAARRSRAIHVFKAEFDGPRPFHVHNFTATGVVSRIFIYESRGQTLLTAECVAEAPDAELRREIQRLTAGFGGASAVLEAQLSASVRSAYLPSMERVRRLAELRRALDRRTGGAFVLAERRADGRVPDLDALSAALAHALEPAPAPIAARA